MRSVGGSMKVEQRFRPSQELQEDLPWAWVLKKGFKVKGGCFRAEGIVWVVVQWQDRTQSEW